MKTAPRDSLIIVERATKTRNALNEPVENWSEHCQEFAAVYYGNGSEQRAAAQNDATQAATFEVLANDETRSITVLDRIVFDGLIWNVRSNVPIRRDGRKITAICRVP